MPDPLGTESRASVSPELEEFAAKAIIDEQLDQAAIGFGSPEGAIVACVTTTHGSHESFSPIRVWRYSQGQLMDEHSDALDRACGTDRSEWPSFTFVFAFESVASTRATIDLHTLYQMGRTERSRGGNAQKWELEKQSGAWLVTKKESYMFWD